MQANLGLGCGCSQIDPITEECIDPGACAGGYSGNPTSMACTCVAGTCIENGNSCASPGYGGSGSPVSTAMPSNSPWLAIATALKSATGILGTRYAVPQLNPGQLIQTSPSGATTMYQAPAGSSALNIPGLNLASGSSSTLLLVGGAALVAFMLFSKK